MNYLSGTLLCFHNPEYLPGCKPCSVCYDTAPTIRIATNHPLVSTGVSDELARLGPPLPTTFVTVHTPDYPAAPAVGNAFALAARPDITPTPIPPTPTHPSTATTPPAAAPPATTNINPCTPSPPATTTSLPPTSATSSDRATTALDPATAAMAHTAPSPPATTTVRVPTATP